MDNQKILKERLNSERKERSMGLRRGAPFIPATEEEMRRVYEEEYLPLLRQDAIDRENTERESQPSRRRRVSRRLSRREQREQEKAEAQRALKKERRKKKKLEEDARQERLKKLTFLPPPPVSEPIENIHIEEDIDLDDDFADQNLLKKMLNLTTTYGIEEDKKSHIKYLSTVSQPSSSPSPPVPRERKSKWDIGPDGEKRRKTRWGPPLYSKILGSVSESSPESINPLQKLREVLKLPKNPFQSSLEYIKSKLPSIDIPSYSPSPSQPSVQIGKKMHLSELQKFYDEKSDRELGNPECKTILTIGWNTEHEKAGKGKDERLEPGVDYFRLNRVKDWRKKLTDTWKAYFTLDDRTWPTVMHYVEGIKFKGDPFMEQYTVESKSKISTNPVMARYAASKSGKYRNRQIRPPNVKMDPLYNANDARIRATRAQMDQNEHLRTILKDTGDACIFTSKDKKIPRKRATWLETVRSEL